MRAVSIFKEDMKMYKRIRQLREALALSQREFGEQLGLSRDVISNIEYNRVEPKELFIKHLCKVYGANEKWLLSGEGEMFSNDKRPNKKLEEALDIFSRLTPDFQDYAIEQIKKLSELQNGK